MGTFYDAVKVGQDLSDTVRLFLTAEDGTPEAGHSVGFVVRNALTGAVLTSGTMVDLAGAPGWYRTPSFIIPSGLLLVQYNPPDAWEADADTIRTVAATSDEAKLDLEFIRSVLAGNWKIVSNQMVFYKEGLPSTELMRFDLFDKLGSPNDEVVFERRKT